MVKAAVAAGLLSVGCEVVDLGICPTPTLQLAVPWHAVVRVRLIPSDTIEIMLRRQGLLEGTWCLDEHETLSPGQAELLTAVAERYPLLTDDGFVAANLHRWLS